MEQSLEVESSSGDIEGPTGYDTEGQLEPTITGEAPVAAVAESSQWIVWYIDTARDVFMPEYFNDFSEAKRYYDRWAKNGHEVILTLTYHAN